MLTSFAQAEKIKLEDNFFNETGFDISDLLSWMKKEGLDEDERFKVISAEEYHKHAEKLGEKTAQLMSKIA